MCGRGESELGQVMLAYTVLFLFFANTLFLPARASEQGNVIGLVSVYTYIYIIKKKL